MAFSAAMSLVSTLGTQIAIQAGVQGAMLLGGSMVNHFLITTAMGAAMNALTPKPSLGDNTANNGYQVSRQGPAQPRQVIYGQTKVGGAIVFDAVSGTNSKFLHRVIAFTGHEIEEFSTIYFNDEALTLTTATENSQTYYKPTLATALDGTTTTRYNDLVKIYQRKGTATQAAPTRLISAGVGWTQDHTLTGCSYLYIELTYNADAFPNGVPSISAKIKGKKVYDTRTASTAWSDNPALVLRDYLTSSDGLGEVAANIDDSLVTLAADICEYENYYNVSGGAYTTTKTGNPRFTCNGSFQTSVKPSDILKDLLTSMGGLLWYAQGKWRMKPAYWSIPSATTLTEDDLISSVAISTRHSRRDNFNTVKGTFRGAATNYQPTDYHEVSASAFVAADGGQVSVYNMDLPFTDDFDICRQIALIALERNRQQLTIQATFGLRAFALQVGDNVKLSFDRFGWSEKEFEVISWTFTLGSGGTLDVQMILQETAQTIFDNVPDSVIYERDNTTLLSPFEVPDIGVAPESASRILSEKFTPELKVVITSADASRVDRVEVQYRSAGSGDYLPVGSGDLGTYSALDLARGNYDVRARAVNTFGVKGDWVYALNFALDPPDDPPANVTNFRGEIAAGGMFFKWTGVDDLDLSFYRIKHTSDTTGSASWDGSEDYIDKVARPATTAYGVARSGTFFIKAYDKGSNASNAADSFSVLPSQLPSLNTTRSQQESPNFLGVSSSSNVVVNTATNPDELRMTSFTGTSNSGSYVFAGSIDGAGAGTYIDTGSVRSVTVAATVNYVRRITYAAQWDNIPSTWDTWPDAWDSWLNESAAFDDHGATVEVAHTNDDPSGTPTWSSFVQAGGQTIVARAFKFRCQLTSSHSGVTPSVQSLSAEASY